MQQIFARIVVVILCALTGTLSVSAQITTGVVSGALKDEQGAVIPGATVTLISDTRGTRVADAQTNENGDFVFPNVPGDTYTVQVTLEGFKTLRRAGVLVSPGDRVVVPTMTLSVGGLGETVNVQCRGHDDPGGQRRARLHGHHASPLRICRSRTATSPGSRRSSRAPSRRPGPRSRAASSGSGAAARTTS